MKNPPSGIKIPSPNRSNVSNHVPKPNKCLSPPEPSPSAATSSPPNDVMIQTIAVIFPLPGSLPFSIFISMKDATPPSSIAIELESAARNTSR